MLRSMNLRTAGAAVFVLASVTLSLPCEAGPPADPIGVWRLKCVSPDGKARACVIVIRREADALKGTYTADGETRDVEEVAFASGVLSVRVGGRFAGRAYGLTYRGKPAGDSLRGTVRWSYGIARGSFPFEGERVGQIVAEVP